MVALVGGIAAVLLGLVGFILWWRPFLELLQGGVPLMLVLGGALATYLGVEEVRDKYRSIKERVEEKPEEVEKLKEETEKYKKEVEDLKKEIESLKKEGKEA
ncbi:MAG TPA: hypothetical protein EYP21_05620 [Syntrophaceae bacterium]|nr:hypothetical protein [Syntrophaceae bacterium]